MHVRMFTGVYTCTLCSCEDQRRERKGSGRETTMAWGLSLFVHKNGVCVGPGPPNSILYQLTPTPRPHTHTRSRTQQRRKPTCTRCFSFFSSFHYCSFCCHKIYCIPSLDFFLKLQVWGFLSHKGRRWGQGCLQGCFFVYMCVRVIYCPPFLIVSVALHETFRLSLVAWLCDVPVCVGERLSWSGFFFPSPLWCPLDSLVCLYQLYSHVFQILTKNDSYFSDFVCKLL